MVPNKKNFCGGNYSDWLEVMLTPDCNGSCEWCIEKDGFKPKEVATTSSLIDTICEYKPNNCKRLKVILLGGEPLLFKDLTKLIEGIRDTVDVYITTNGALLTPEYIEDNLVGIKGINVSIHHYDLTLNSNITGIKLNQEQLESSIIKCRQLSIETRFNCNLIKNNICDTQTVGEYVLWAKKTGADKIRFAELKDNESEFVNTDDLLDINSDPYVDGCSIDVIMNDIPVNFRRMCGLQTSLRPIPINPKTVRGKSVLYYDGGFYEGWQKQDREQRIVNGCHY